MDENLVSTVKYSFWRLLLVAWPWSFRNRLDIAGYEVSKSAHCGRYDVVFPRSGLAEQLK